MDAQTAASAYTQATFENAPPIKILHLMYEGALRFLEQAEALDPDTSPTEFNDRLSRADAVVSELRISLEPEHAPELAESLSSLYLFVEGRIRDAFLDRTTAPIPEARQVLQTLLDGWKQVVVQESELGSTGS